MIKKEYKNILILIGIILGIIVITMGFNLFGSDTDWINQHTVIPDYFRKMFYETGNLIPNFSFNYGSGINMFNLAYYGFLSPIILLSYLLPFVEMKTYLIVVNIIILIVSVTLFYMWLRNNKFNSKMSLLVSIVFIMAGPIIFQMHRHMMFVNYMPFLIMCLMGVDKLTKENKKSLLIVSTFLMIMTSFYYSVSGILVLFLYYIYKNIHSKNKIKVKDLLKKVLAFLLIILIPILMSSILILPTLYTILDARNNSVLALNLIVPLFDTTKILYGGYSLGLTFIAIASILWFCYNRKKNETTLGVLLLIIFFIPLFTYLLNGGLYLRGKVFIPFIPLVCFIIGKFISDLIDKKINIKEFIVFLIIINILVIASNVTSIIYYIDVIGFIIILILYDKFKINKIIYVYVVCISLFTGIYMNFTEDYIGFDEYEELFYDNSELIENIDNYRVSNLVNSSYSVNNILSANYYTTNIYSSTYNKYYYNFVRNIFKVNNPYYNSFLLGSVNNIMFNTLMGNKYIISEVNPGMGYTKISNNDKYKLYKNDDAFSIGFVNSNVMGQSYFETLTYPYNIEALLNYIIVDESSKVTYGTNIEQYSADYSKVLTGLTITKNKNKYEINVNKKGEMDIYLKEPLEGKILFIDFSGLTSNKCKTDEISITIDNIKNSLTCDTWIYPNNNNVFHYVIDRENIEKLHIEFSAGTYNIEDINVYTLDYSDIVKDYDRLNIESIKDNTIKGNIKVNNDGYFMLTIPYDEGFTVYVDDKKTEYELVDETFVGFPITKGEYNIKVVYNSPWLNIGKVMSVIGVVIFLGILGKEEYKKEVR